MANGVNRVILVGNLGADPELRSTGTGKQVANFNLATSRRWSNTDGEMQEATEWHRIVVWGRMADICHRYLSKGRQVYVEGRLQHRKYTDRDGHERYTSEIVAQQVVFLGGGRQAMGAATADDRLEGMSSSPSYRSPAAPSDFGETAATPNPVPYRQAAGDPPF
jgi:single-strand DNA-binding protein